MSDFGSSLRSSRRSSISSRTSVATTSTLPPLHVQSVRNFSRSSWFETYQFFVNSLPALEFVDHELYVDALKCLCDEKLSNSATIHLLALFEYFAHLFIESDILEQIVGSLLNLITTRKWKPEIQQKLICTSCTLLLTNYELVESNTQIKDILDLYIKTLIKYSGAKDNSLLSTCCAECLIQIETMFPKYLKSWYEKDELPIYYLPLKCAILVSQLLNKADRTQIKKDLPGMMERNSINFYRCLTFIFEYLTESNDTSDLNSNVFRPFLVSLTYTSEMQAFHLCLQLFQKFEFIFTHELLHFLLRHLLSACTHPALIPSQRLMFLDFVCDLLPTFKDVEMVDDLQLMEIQPAFDGPDTQEKKLAILTHGPTPDDQLLFCLKPLKQLSLINLNPRASNALYRCLNRMLLLRPSMVSTIEYLLLSMILKSPQQHICRTLSLLRLWPQLSEHVLRLIIQETIDHTDNFHDESELKAYFQAFEWILRKVDFQIDEQDTIGILNFICKKSETSGTLHSYAINCCSAVIRNQFLTQSVKQNLTGCLKLLSSSPHLTLQQSSWVQIFLIGIQSLPNEDNFKRIFNDPLAFETITIKRTRKDVDFPIEVHALNSKDANSISFERYIDKPFQLPLKFELSINCQFKNQHEENPVSELFTIEFGIENEMQQILEEVTINYLNETKPITVEFAVEIKNIVEFDLNINARCSNMLGHLFTNTTMTRQIELIDMMLPCEITSDQFHQVWLQQANRTDSVLNGWIKHVITLRHVQTISDLINRLPWIKRFLISQNLIAIAIPNNIFIFGHLIEIDQTVNWKVITNRSIGLKPLLVQLSTLM